MLDLSPRGDTPAKCRPQRVGLSGDQAIPELGEARAATVSSVGPLATRSEQCALSAQISARSDRRACYWRTAREPVFSTRTASPSTKKKPNSVQHDLATSKAIADNLYSPSSSHPPSTLVPRISAHWLPSHACFLPRRGRMRGGVEDIRPCHNTSIGYNNDTIIKGPIEQR